MQSLNVFFITIVLALNAEGEENFREWTFKKTQETFSGEFMAFHNNRILIRTSMGIVSIRPRDLTRRDVKYYRNILQSASKGRARLNALKLAKARYGNKKYLALNSRNKSYYLPISYLLMIQRTNQNCTNYFRTINNIARENYVRAINARRCRQAN